MEQNLKDKYYVRLLTEKDREEVEQLDAAFNTDVAYQLDHTDHTSRGYGLFQRGEYAFDTDKLIAQCSIERDLEDFSEDDKNNSLSNIQKKFKTYDLHRAFQFFEINKIPSQIFVNSAKKSNMNKRIGTVATNVMSKDC